MTSTLAPDAEREVPDYAFARRPKWLVSHVLVLALIGSLLAAGVWQINRHGERADQNDVVSARSAEDPVPVRLVAPPGASPDVGEAEQFRRVVLRGEFQPDDEVLIRNRSLEGAPGWWVLTPLLTEDGWAVAVNRGWIPSFFDDDEPRPGTEAPTGTVEIIGTVQPSRVAEGFQVADPDEGRLLSLARPDVARLAQQLDYELSPIVVRVEPESAGDQDQPIALALPTLDSGPHASYAVQWFIFATIAIVGYPLVLRRVSQGRASSAPEYEDDPPSDPA